MAHARAQIRDAVVAALTGLPTTENRVHASRLLPVQERELPCLLVYASEEASNADAMRTNGGRGLTRLCSIRVEGLCRSLGDLDTIAERMAAEVEGALGADPKLGGLAQDLQLVQTQLAYADEGGQPTAGIRMIFAVRYRTREHQPETAI